MSLKMKVVSAKDLPSSASHGFMLIDPDEPRREMFFHWNENELDDGALVSYEDVLKALPDRLAAMGFESQTDEILGKVVNKFGAGGE